MKAVQQPRKNGWGLRFYLRVKPYDLQGLQGAGLPGLAGRRAWQQSPENPLDFHDMLLACC